MHNRIGQEDIIVRMLSKLPVLVLLLLIGLSRSEDEVFTNDWSVHVPGGVEHAKIVAKDTGCQYGHEIIPGTGQVKLCLYICYTFYLI